MPHFTFLNLTIDTHNSHLFKLGQYLVEFLYEINSFTIICYFSVTVQIKMLIVFYS